MSEIVPPSAPTRRKPSSRFAGLAIGAAGIVLLFLAIPWPQTSARKASETNASASRGGLALERDAPGRLVDSPEEMRLPPARRRTLFFRAAPAPPHYDGSLERPWGGDRVALETAFARLEPGDRLVILPGRYRGPVVVDAPARDGTAELPIEVWGRVDAIFSGSDERPVFEVRRAHWTFYGLELVPGERSRAGFVTRGEGARYVVLDDAHVHGGAYAAILIAPGSRDVTLRNNHVRGFAPRRERPGDPMPSAAEVEENRDFPVFAVGIAPGAEGVTLRGNNLHNVVGRLVWTIPPAEAGRLAPLLVPNDPALRHEARGVDVDASNALQENWAAGGEI